MAHPKDICSVGLLEKLKLFINYDKNTGELTWKCTKQKIKLGQRAGYVDSRGYVNLNFCSHRLMGHRVAWALHYGKWPLNQIDHADMNPSNNKLNNLREATDCQNKANTKARPNKIYSTLKGVTYDKRRKKWQTTIYRNGHKKFLGYFDTAKKAYFVYCKAVKLYDGEFARVA